MSSSALFTNSTSRSTPKNLVEFKAGKMTMKGKMVYPDVRKGQLYVYQSDDSLMHFCWKDRVSGYVEDDLIIFPDDCEFKHVPQCKTGRVYLLRFKSSNKKFFVWLQDLKTDKDEEHCRKINEVLNNPPTPGSQRSGSTNTEGDLQNILNNMSQQQLMQLFGGVSQIGLGSLLGTMNRPQGVQSTRTSTTNASTRVTTNASTSTTQATPSPVAASDSPKPNGDNKAAVKTTDSSASGTTQSSNNKIHFSDLQNFLLEIPAAAGSDSTVQSGQAGPVVRQFGLGQDAVNAAATGNIEEFVTALETEAKNGQGGKDQDADGDGDEDDDDDDDGVEESKKEKTTGKPTLPPTFSLEKKDDDDEGMALD